MATVRLDERRIPALKPLKTAYDSRRSRTVAASGVQISGR